MTDRRAWTENEDKAIVELVKNFGISKWTMIAEKMQQEYCLKGRSGKQCRERWHNHLDPSISKLPWTSKEEEIIFEQHKLLGNKWADIAKLLPGSTLRRSLRRINKQLGDKNSTAQVKDIKPGALSKIFSLSDQSISDENDENQKKIIQMCKGLEQNLMTFANFKPKKNCSKIQNKVQEQQYTTNEVQQQDFRKLIEKIMEFNKQEIQQQKQKKSEDLVKKGVDILLHLINGGSCDQDQTETKEIKSEYLANSDDERNQQSNYDSDYGNFFRGDQWQQQEQNYEENEKMKIFQSGIQESIGFQIFGNALKKQQQDINASQDAVNDISPKISKNLFAVSPLASIRAGIIGYQQQQTPRVNTTTTPNQSGITLDQYLDSKRAITQNNDFILQNSITASLGQNYFEENQKSNVFDKILTELKESIEINNINHKYIQQDNNNKQLLQLDLNLIDETVTKNNSKFIDDIQTTSLDSNNNNKYKKDFIIPKILILKKGQHQEQV